MHSPTQKIVIYQSKAKMLLVLCGSLLFVAGGFFIHSAFSLSPEFSAKVAVAIYIGIPFFGLCALYAIYRLVVKSPALTISPEGLDENASACGAGFIPWDEIERIETYEYRGQKLLGIFLYDQEKLIARLSAFKKSMAQANTSLLPTVVNIPQIAVEMPLDELQRTIESARVKQLG